MSQRTTMTRKMSFEFADYVKAKYLESGLNNVKFAAQATEHLPFPVTQTMVRTMLQDLDIAPNVSRNTAVGRANVQLLSARVVELEAQVQRLVSMYYNCDMVQTMARWQHHQDSLTDWDTTKEAV